MVAPERSELKSGWKTAATIYEVSGRYSVETPEMFAELEKLGVAREDREKLAIGSDLSLKGLVFSLGAFAFYIRHGQVYRTRKP